MTRQDEIERWKTVYRASLPATRLDEKLDVAEWKLFEVERAVKRLAVSRSSLVAALRAYSAKRSAVHP